MGLGLNIGIDLGTATVIIYVVGKGIVLREPAVVALHSKTGKVLAVGESASLMLGRTPDIVQAVRPLRDGVISDFQVTEVMLKNFISRVNTGFLARYFKPTIVVCVPSVITQVETRAVEDACRNAGAKARHADKDHKYFTCKTCGTVCRVPVGKGKIIITCPKCGAQIQAKT